MSDSLVGNLSRSMRGVVVSLCAGALGLSACAAPMAVGHQTADDECAVFEKFGEIPASTVTIRSAWTGQEAEDFTRSLEIVERCTAITVVHAGSEDFSTSIVEDAREGQGPDIAVVPQRAVADALVEDGSVHSLSPTIRAQVEAGWDRSWAEIGEYGGQLYAAPVQAAVKSFVWFDPAAFDQAGYEVPQTWDELESLTAQVVADHPDHEVVPWCLGVSASSATGWALSDWLEDVMLRHSGPAIFDAWATHRIPANAPDAVESLDMVGHLLFAPGRTQGLPSDATRHSLDDSIDDLIHGRCLMLHGSSALESRMPDDGAMRVFYMPSDSDGDDDEQPVLVGADYAVLIRPSLASTVVMEYLTSPEWTQGRAQLGGFSTANRAVSSDDLSSPVQKVATQFLQSRQSAVRYDASDAMPRVIGEGVLWSQLTSWARGTATSQLALDAVEDAWNQVESDQPLTRQSSH